MFACPRVRLRGGRVLALVLTLGSCAAVAAEDAALDARLTAQRDTFARAYAAVRSGHYETARRLRASLDGYVLTPYLEYEDLWRNFHRRDIGTIEAFLERHAGSVLADRLRTAWLRHLARRAEWERYVSVYRPQVNDELECQYLGARVKSGLTDGDFLTLTRDIWLTGESLPDACDPAFEVLYASDLMSDALLWQRIRLAMAARRPALARYLGRKFKDADNVRLLEAWQSLYVSPARLAPGAVPEDTPLGRHVIVHTLERRARQNLDAALTLWPRLSEHYHFTPGERSLAVKALALRAARADHDDALILLDGIAAEHVDEAVEHARLTTALKHAAWDALARWTEHPSSHPGHALMWRYWRARALDEAGNPEVAHQLYEALAGERDYYGYLAADRIGAPYRFTHVPVAPADDEMADFASRPAIARIVELFETGYEHEARREWWHELGRMDRRDMELAAALVRDLGHHHRAIMTLGRARSYDDLDIRFPLLHRATVEEYGDRRDIDPAVLFSIIRAESAFLTDARSPVGARGLMQLMPATALETARHIGLKYRGPDTLEEPRINIMLGSAYLKRMLDRYDGNFAMASAAYNAGPHRVRRWQAPDRCTPLDVWVELVPFSETRSYIRRTLFYSRVYQWRLERDIARIAEAVAAIPPRNGSIATC